MHVVCVDSRDAIDRYSIALLCRQRMVYRLQFDQRAGTVIAQAWRRLIDCFARKVSAAAQNHTGQGRSIAGTQKTRRGFPRRVSARSDHRDEKFFVLGRPGSDLLFQALRLSTIGAEEFNGRVRYGNGFRLLARTTRSAKDEKCKLVFFLSDAPFAANPRKD